MKAILTVMQKDKNKIIEESLLFDTEKGRKICDIKNSFNVIVQELYLSLGGILFIKNKRSGKLEVPDQDKAKKYVGENHPETYMKFFEEVREA